MAELASEEEKQAVHVFLSHISRFKSTYESWKEARQASIATLRELVQTLNTTSKRVNLTNVTSASLGAPVGVAAVVSGALVCKFYYFYIQYILNLPYLLQSKYHRPYIFPPF